jgi:hypothetical protein
MFGAMGAGITLLAGVKKTMAHVGDPLELESARLAFGGEYALRLCCIPLYGNADDDD